MAGITGVPHLIPHKIQINGNEAGEIQLRVRAAASQTATVLEVQNSAGTTLFSVDNDGDVSITGNLDAVVNQTLTGNITLSGNLVVNGNTTLGNASSDTFTINATPTFVTAISLTTALTSTSSITSATLAVTGSATVGTNLVVGGTISTQALTVSGVMSGGTGRFADGTAALPSISFTADVDTGMYLAAGNQIGWSAGGVVELTLNATNLSPGANDGLALGVSGTAFADLFLASGAVINFAAGDVTITHSSGLLTISDDVTISQAGNLLTLTNTTDAASNQVAIFESDRATPTDNDSAYISLRLSNDLGTQTEFARLEWIATDVNNGTSEDGQAQLYLVAAGSLGSRYTFSSTILRPSSNDGAGLGVSGTAWSDLFLASGAVINFVAGDVTLTHSTDTLTLAGNFTVTGIAVAGGATSLSITPGGHTAVTAEIIDFNLAAHAVTLTDGTTIASTSSVSLGATTYNGVAAGGTETVTLASTLTIAAPIQGTNLTLTEGRVINAAADTDATTILGRARIHSPNTDQAIFAHFDMSNNQQYALGQSAAGLTVINAAAGQTVRLAIAGSSEIIMTTTDFSSAANDGMTLGISGTAWSDLFLASGAVIDFAAGDVTITHASNLLTVAGGDFAMGNDALIRRDVNAGLTASTTQTQGNGPLTAEINEVATVANANDTVTLPTAVAGLRIVIINNGANTLRIFPASGDNLGAGVDTATTLAAGSNVIYQSFDDTNWESI